MLLAEEANLFSCFPAVTATYVRHLSVAFWYSSYTLLKSYAHMIWIMPVVLFE